MTAKTKKPTAHSRYRKDLPELPDWMRKKACPHRDKYFSGSRVLPRNLTGREKLADIVDDAFLAYTSGRLRERCQLFVEKMLEPDVTIGMSLSGALTPAGLGVSSIVPLIKAGYSDCLMATDETLRAILLQPEFQKEMGTAEMHHTYSGIIFEHCPYHIQAFKQGPPEVCAVFGQTCDGLDTISQSEMLPDLQLDDLVYSVDIGTYSNASTTWFNGFPPAKVVHINEQ